MNTFIPKFKKNTLCIAVLSCLSASTVPSVSANEVSDPQTDSDVKLIQVNNQTKDKNIASLVSEGQGGIVLKGNGESSVVQQVLSNFVNRGNDTEYSGNILDITVNNDVLDSLNTFYVSQIGGSWLVMNVNGYDNTFTITDLAGTGYVPDSENMEGAVKIDVVGNNNTLSLTPSFLGNIAKQLQVDITNEASDVSNDFNVVHISYTEFSEITTNLVNASYSYIDIEQTDTYNNIADDVELTPNIVVIDIVDAVESRLMVEQNGMNNILNVDINNSANVVSVTQDSNSQFDENTTDININGMRNSVTTTQKMMTSSTSDGAENSIDVDIVNGNGNQITIEQNSYAEINPVSTAQVTIDGNNNIANVEQSIEVDNVFDWGASQDVTVDILGDDNEYSLKGFWHVMTNVNILGDENIIRVSDSSHTTGHVGDINFEGNKNSLVVNGNQSSSNFKDNVIGNGEEQLRYSFSIFGDGNESFINNNGFFMMSSLMEGDLNTLITNINSWSHNDIFNIIQGNANQLNISLGSSDGSLYGLYGQSIVETQILGNENNVSLASSFSQNEFNNVKNIYDTFVDGDNNNLVINDNRNGGSQLETVVLGSDNAVNIGGEKGNIAENAFTYVSGTNNILSMDSLIYDSYMHVGGQDNIVTMTGVAGTYESSYYRSFIRGAENNISIDITGLDAHAYVDVTGDRNVMSFNLGAGFLDYDLVGSDFEGSVNTYEASSYYQTLTKMGTGIISMETDGGIVNICSNMQNECTNAI
jgi:hypothetical protein